MLSRLVFKDSMGRELRMEDLEGLDLEGVTGVMAWKIVGTGTIPPEASRLHQEGREAGARGEFAGAIELLDHAHRLAPDWPYPVYDAAFTHLLQGEYERAEELYAEVDRMSPRGFYTTKTALDCLRRERAGTVPRGLCGAFTSLEWLEDATEKKGVLEAMVAQFPAFPAAWNELSVLLEDDEACLEAIAHGLEHDPDGETKGRLLINKAMILHRRGDGEGAVGILGELALDPQSTVATEALAKLTLSQILRG
jgi:tetratricopeptide (TPR) repeat protein